MQTMTGSTISFHFYVKSARYIGHITILITNAKKIPRSRENSAHGNVMVWTDSLDVINVVVCVRSSRSGKRGLGGRR